MPFLPIQRVAGHSKVARRGSTTLYSINGSLRPLGPGLQRSSNRFSCGTTGVQHYSHQNILPGARRDFQNGPLASSGRNSLNSAQQRSHAWFGCCVDATTSDWHGRWAPLRHRLVFPSFRRYIGMCIIKYEYYLFFVFFYSDYESRAASSSGHFRDS
jgi:hypothetical protein